MDVPLLMSSLSGARELAALLVNERDRQKAVAIQIELSEKLLKAQAELAQVLGTVIGQSAALQAQAERIGQLEAAQAEKARYQLAELSPGRNVFAYRLRAAAELLERADEPPHFICQPCFDGGKKGVLNERDMWGSSVWRCPLCATELVGGRYAGR